MKRGKDLGIETIKTVAKEGTQQLKDLHCTVNDVMYKYSWKYISPKMSERIYNQLAELGKELNNLSVPDKAKAKKEEILNAIRTVLRNLKAYGNGYRWMQTDADEVQKSLGFLLSDYLNHKGDEDFDAVKALAVNKEIWDDMYMACPYQDRIKTDKFKSMQSELLEVVKTKYALVS